MTWLLRPFVESARRWGVGPGATVAALVFPFIGLAILPLLWATAEAAFRFLTQEDGIIEWTQFAAFVASCVVAAMIARQRWSTGHAVQAGLFALAAFALFLISAEEISWGQRILGYEAPEAIREINDQDEMTFHNISGVLIFFNVGMLLVSLYAIVAEPVIRRLRLAERWADAEILFAPPLFLASAFGVMAVFRVLRLAFLEGGYGVNRIGEWAELCFALAILIFLGLALRRLRAAEPAREVATGQTS